MSAAAKLLGEAREVDRELHGPRQGAMPGPDGAPGAMPESNAGMDPIYDPAAEWAFIPQAIGGLVAMAMPELAPVYSEQACMKWGQAMHAVAQKRGWQATTLGPEVALAVATFALAWPTLAALKARQDKAAKRDIEPAPVEQEAETGGGGEAHG